MPGILLIAVLYCLQIMSPISHILLFNTRYANSMIPTTMPTDSHTVVNFASELEILERVSKRLFAKKFHTFVGHLERLLLPVGLSPGRLISFSKNLSSICADDNTVIAQKRQPKRIKDVRVTKSMMAKLNTSRRNARTLT